jgi:hypothetical protein
MPFPLPAYARLSGLPFPTGGVGMRGCDDFERLKAIDRVRNAGIVI